MSSVQFKGKNRRPRAPGSSDSSDNPTVSAPLNGEPATETRTVVAAPVPAPSVPEPTKREVQAPTLAKARPGRRANRPNIKLFSATIVEGQTSFKGNIESVPAELAEQLVDEAVQNSNL